MCSAQKQTEIDAYFCPKYISSGYVVTLGNTNYMEYAILFCLTYMYTVIVIYMTLFFFPFNFNFSMIDTVSNLANAKPLYILFLLQISFFSFQQ